MAPAEIKSWTDSVLPILAASSSDVVPVLEKVYKISIYMSFAFTLAPAAIKSWTVSESPFSAAK